MSIICGNEFPIKIRFHFFFNMSYIPNINTYLLFDLGFVYMDNGESTIRISKQKYKEILSNEVDDEEYRTIFSDFLIPCKADKNIQRLFEEKTIKNE